MAPPIDTKTLDSLTTKAKTRSIFGTRIKSLRVVKGLNQQELAQSLGYASNRVAYYESSTRNPNPETVKKFADFFGVTVDDMLNGTGTVIPTKPAKVRTIFGSRIKSLRAVKGITQRELAQSLGYAHKTVAYFENTAKNPNAENVKKFADIFGVTVGDMLNDTSPVIPSNQVVNCNLAKLRRRNTTKIAPIFGKRIAALRAVNGLTQDKLAKSLGVTREVIAAYERTTKNPRVTTVKKIADFFGVTVGDMLNDGASL